MQAIKVFSRWSDAMRKYAEESRGVQSFGPNHPAVRAAKRWCERTGKTWEIGMGGRCELGKRALKQWFYELTLPLRKMPGAKWVALAIFVVAAYIASIVWQVKFVSALIMTLLMIAALVAGLLVGGVTAYLQADKEKVFSEIAPVPPALWVVAWVLLFPAALVSYLVMRMVRSRFFVDHEETIGKVFLALLVVAVGGAFIALMVALFIKVGWVAFLVSLAIVIGAVIFVAGMIIGAIALADLAGRKAKANQLHLKQAARKDPFVQRRALSLYEAALHEYYKESQSFAQHPVSYEVWIAKFESVLKEQNLVWSDLIVEYPGSKLQFLRDEPVLGPLGYYRLIYALEDLYEAGQTPYERRTGRIKQGLLFVGSTWFLIKSRVCPNVILPPIEVVKP